MKKYFLFIALLAPEREGFEPISPGQAVDAKSLVVQ